MTNAWTEIICLMTDRLKGKFQFKVSHLLSLYSASLEEKRGTKEQIRQPGISSVSG